MRSTMPRRLLMPSPDLGLINANTGKQPGSSASPAGLSGLGPTSDRRNAGRWKSFSEPPSSARLPDVVVAPPLIPT
jgi:hypothetical protein